MPITREDVERTAQLARLGLSIEEKERLVGQLSSILVQIEKVAQVDASMALPTAQILPLSNITRADVVQPSLTPDEVLANAADRDGNFFKIRAVLE